MRAVNDINDLTGRMPEAGRLNMFQTQAMKIESWNATGFAKFSIVQFPASPGEKDISDHQPLTR